MNAPLFTSVFFALSSDPIGILDALTIIPVVAVLFLAKGVLSLRQRVDELENASKRPAPSQPPSAPGAGVPLTGAPANGSISTEILAVIAAAVHFAMPGNARIVGISSSPAPTDDRAWSLEGRRQIFQSHKVR